MGTRHVGDFSLDDMDATKFASFRRDVRVAEDTIRKKTFNDQIKMTK